ncbi:hypothetical protein D3C81_2084870 [compost metagenome]
MAWARAAQSPGMFFSAVRRASDWLMTESATAVPVMAPIWVRVRSMTKSGGTAPAAKSACIRARSWSMPLAKSDRRDR